jgi:hypothetical protein
MIAFATLLAQDGAPPAAAPQTKPQPDPQPAPQAAPTKPQPLPQTTPNAPVRPAPSAKPVAANAKPAQKDGKALVVPTPKPKEPEIPSFRVSVIMPGNRRFTGVVTRDKLFSDLVRMNAHNTQDVYRRHENFTLRFVDGVDGDVTLRWDQIQKLDVRAILDAAGLRTIEEDYHRLMIVKKEQQEAEQARQEAEEAKQRKLREDAKPGEDEKKEKEKVEELPPLLAEFRPDEGWSTQRKEQIEWRRTVVGTGPDKAEQRFLEIYPQWLEAFNAWKAARANKPAEGEKGDPQADDAKKGDAKKEAPKGDDAKKDEVKKDEPKPDDAKKDDAKKEEPKKDDAKKDDVKKDEAPKEPVPATDPKDGGGGSR